MKILDMSVPYSYSFQNHDNKVVKNGKLNFDRILWKQAIAGLAYHPQIQEKIDSIYQNDKKRFSKYVGVNYLESDAFFYSFPADIVLYMKKLSAIYQSLPEGENQEFLVSLIKEGYKRYADFSQEQKGTFSVWQFSDSLHKRNIKGKVSEGHVNLAIGMILYLRFYERSYKVYEDVLFDTILHNLIKDNEVVITSENFQSQRRKEIEKKAFQIYEKYMGKRIPRKQFIDEIMTDIELKAMKFHSEEFHKKGIDMNLVYSTGMNRFLKPLTSALYGYGLNEFYIWENIEYTREDYLDFYLQFENHICLNRLTEEDFEMSFATHLILFVLIKQYKNVSNALLNELKREDHFLLEAQKQKLIEDKQDFFRERNQIAKEKEQFLQKESSYQEEIQALTKRIKELEQREQDNERLKREVITLREYAFIENQIEDDVEDNIEESSIRKLQQMNLKIVLFGGHVRFVQKMKGLFPSIRTVSPNELNVDISFVNHMDIILFVTSYNNHSNYNRLQEALKSENVLLYFINREKSMNRIASSILNKLK